MDGAGAVGLDLSFVSWLFLMEPLPDRSLEEQVVARAHRMGALRPILVETLVMRVRPPPPPCPSLSDRLTCVDTLRKAPPPECGTQLWGALIHPYFLAFLLMCSVIFQKALARSELAAAGI